MRLLLIRHGMTDLVAANRYTGQLDPPLNALGQQQAEALAYRLAGERLDALVASDLQRAQATAQAIARRHPRVSVEADADLRELAMGAWEGATHAEVAARDAAALREWQLDPMTCAPPGGETLEQMRGRVVRGLRRWYAPTPEATVAWVTHGGVIRVLLAHLLGVPLAQHWQFRCDPASIGEVAYGMGPDGSYAILQRWNDQQHRLDRGQRAGG